MPLSLALYRKQLHLVACPLSVADGAESQNPTREFCIAVFAESEQDGAARQLETRDATEP